MPSVSLVTGGPRHFGPLQQQQQQGIRRGPSIKITLHGPGIGTRFGMKGGWWTCASAPRIYTSRFEQWAAGPNALAAIPGHPWIPPKYSNLWAASMTWFICWRYSLGLVRYFRERGCVLVFFSHSCFESKLSTSIPWSLTCRKFYAAKSNVFLLFFYFRR